MRRNIKVGKRITPFIAFLMIATVLCSLVPVFHSVAAEVSSGGTFGSTSVGGSVVGTGSGGAKTGGCFQLLTAGTVSKLTAYVSGFGSGFGYAKAAIYSDLNGQPNMPVGGATAQVVVPASAGWVDFVYASPVSLQPGYYWLTLVDSAGCNWYYNAGGVSAWNWVSYGSEPVSPFGSHTDRSDLISIYATYSLGSSSYPVSNQIAAVSATASSYNGVAYGPLNAIDGIESNSNYWGTAAASGLPQWLKVDLGSAVSISQVVTHFYDGSTRTYTYYVDVSVDGSSWTPVVSTKTGNGIVTDIFSQVYARYVRITVTGNTANTAAHIEEFKVFSST